LLRTPGASIVRSPGFFKSLARYLWLGDSKTLWSDPVCIPSVFPLLGRSSAARSKIDRFFLVSFHSVSFPSRDGDFLQFPFPFPVDPSAGRDYCQGLDPSPPFPFPAPGLVFFFIFFEPNGNYFLFPSVPPFSDGLTVPPPSVLISAWNVNSPQTVSCEGPLKLIF